MIHTSSKKISLIIALLTVCFIVFCGLLIINFAEYKWIIISSAIFIVFVCIYITSNTLISRFIVSKVVPLYKTILNKDLTVANLSESINEKELLSNTKDLVNDLNSNQLKEISDLKKLEVYRREFIGNVSHELKTPIFNIQGYILTLLEGGLEDPTINLKYLERTEKSINRLITIVDDLEAISRLESGELKLEYEKFNLYQLIADVFESLEIASSQKKIKLLFGKNLDKSTNVLADRKRITQVLTNLISNSIFYGSSEGSTIVSFFVIHENVMVEVSDNGIGIAEKHLNRIFDRFYRVDKSRSREQGGTGLGLSIVKHIIEAHNQSISVRSKAGEGTSFTFTLQKA
ncbi:MAG: two-component sensor histidine kinase [Bacteroidetes bacterium GWA2_31_9]|nr:MAG: two-component sensor histidine kinase [Bacteroidetes bacterium GWA2_31_9]